ncbi:hypothetical protein QO200_10435 [Flavobacterium sp. Arc3]|uniref:hypothetical protein n=1 Tax=Flavobacterium sp. Arc3 TaxID=3046686 RepID=UPI00352EE455
MNNSQINILNDFLNLYLVIFGIAITLFTVIYSFIVNKKEELLKILDSINQGNNSPLTDQKRYFTILQIKRYKAINKHLIAITILSISLYITSFITNRILSSYKIKLILFYGISIITIILFIYILIIIAKVIFNYKKNTKI